MIEIEEWKCQKCANLQQNLKRVPFKIYFILLLFRFTVRLSVYLSVCISVRLSVCPPVYLYVTKSEYLKMDGQVLDKRTLPRMLLSLKILKLFRNRGGSRGFLISSKITYKVKITPFPQTSGV